MKIIIEKSEIESLIRSNLKLSESVEIVLPKDVASESQIERLKAAVETVSNERDQMEKELAEKSKIISDYERKLLDDQSNMELAKNFETQIMKIPLEKRQKVDMIKHIHNKTRLGLAESKKLYEDLENGNKSLMDIIRGNFN